MKIREIYINNFKRFQDKEFEFNDDINIFVGDNESGKSTILEAIELCTNFLHRGKPIGMELSTDLFNNRCIADYIDSDKSQDKLPEIVIETYIEGHPEFKGTNNRKRIDTEGMYVKICFDQELVESYESFVADPSKIVTIPVELYKIEWFSFSWKRITYHNKKIGCLFVDPTRLHPTLGRSKYINKIINSALEKNARSTLNLNYRQLRNKFDQEPDVALINEKLDADNIVTDKSLKITADIGNSSGWDSNLQLTVDEVSFDQIGKGEQNQIQIKLALQNNSKDVDIVLLEEPENHLSHMNLSMLISHIEKNNSDKQIFITTHSSYVLNKLSINKLCLLAKSYKKMKEIDAATVKTLKRLPGYDTLRVVLAQKTVLVEGPSDELVLKRIFRDKQGHLPEEDGIDIIVVRGIGFKNYLNIVTELEHPSRVVKDNDGNYQKNITQWFATYLDNENLECFSPNDDELNSLEPALISANCSSVEELDNYSKVILSAKTFNNYIKLETLKKKREFLLDWFEGDDAGRKKVDSAIRIFDSTEAINFPEYLAKAVEFDA